MLLKNCMFQGQPAAAPHRRKARVCFQASVHGAVPRLGLACLALRPQAPTVHGMRPVYMCFLHFRPPSAVPCARTKIAQACRQAAARRLGCHQARLLQQSSSTVPLCVRQAVLLGRATARLFASVGQLVDFLAFVASG